MSNINTTSNQINANGLVNLGNSCYLNSILQAIASSHHFIQSLENHQQQSIQLNCKKSCSLSHALYNCLSSIRSNENKSNSSFAFCPGEVHRIVSSKGYFQINQQNVCVVFFSYDSFI